jgi:hypothetical protein
MDELQLRQWQALLQIQQRQIELLESVVRRLEEQTRGGPPEGGA